MLHHEKGSLESSQAQKKLQLSWSDMTSELQECHFKEEKIHKLIESLQLLKQKEKEHQKEVFLSPKLEKQREQLKRRMLEVSFP